MFIQTGPARWTDASHATRLGLARYVAPVAPAKAAKPTVSKAAPPIPAVRQPALTPRVPKPAKVAPSLPIPLPPAPAFPMQARDMGPHELRTAGTRAKLWLTAANAASCVRRLTSDERHGVECTKARLVEMRQAAGLDSANW